MEYLKAFLVGGAICAVGQLLLDKTKLTPARIVIGTVNLKAVDPAFPQGFSRRFVQLEVLHRVGDDQRAAAGMDIRHNLPPVRQPQLGVAPAPHGQLIPVEIGDRIGAAFSRLIRL